MALSFSAPAVAAGQGTSIDVSVQHRLSLARDRFTLQDYYGAVLLLDELVAGRERGRRPPGDRLTLVLLAEVGLLPDGHRTIGLDAEIALLDPVHLQGRRDLQGAGRAGREGEATEAEVSRAVRDLVDPDVDELVDEDAGRCVVEDGDVDGRCRYDPDVAVDAAIEREVRIQWRDVVVMAVVDADRDDVASIEPHEVRDIERERGVAADVTPAISLAARP